MVLQQANMALMFLGKVPHPQTGEHVHEPETARVFIDQLEMLEAKTRGNLSPQEDKLLKDTLMSVRLQFVEAVNASSAQASTPATGASSPSGTPASGETAPSDASASEEESRKKFTKKY